MTQEILDELQALNENIKTLGFINSMLITLLATTDTQNCTMEQLRIRLQSVETSEQLLKDFI